ncbi:MULTISPECIES: ABC transporter substrate-binding protein [Halolamina]|uniref:Peptide/nickel transport system substrate-binding protein n=1 Tax=Halolamina pelagica TaxID=699431 RepID=A0A1I5QAR9_9EURY|nr:MULTISPECIES: ABC transporter substrate-binding protein [Halolamina]NHX35169.1 ABC transporter substrate-binding protein [Halolamina sp. R1-12]SFP43090.1 peptide/nickel transport system substrate-binding protein [Halolamina pelagica]
MAEDSATDRRTFLSAVGGAAAAAMAGCTGDGTPTDPTSTTAPPSSSTDVSTPEGGPQPGGTLRVGFESELTGLDPHRTESVVSWVVVFNVCETLITFEDGAPAGRLATDWEIGEDGRTYTFTLTEDARFHPPVDRGMTAEDVVYSFERMNQDGAMGSDLAAVEAVEATGEYEVTFTLAETFAPFFNFLGRVPWVIVPEEAVEEQGGDLGEFQEPVGTGPFQFDEHEPGDHLTLTAFDDYRADDVPLLDAVEITPIPDADSRVSALRGGDVDMVRGVGGSDADVVRNDAETKLSRQRGTEWGQLHINCSEPPWDDPAVRRAVAHAMDRGAIVDAAVSGYGQPAWQPYAEESVWHYDLGDSRRTHDPERARQILDDAGNPLESETLTIKTNTRYGLMETTAELLVAQLAQAGIDAETEVLEWGTQLSDFVGGNFGAMAFSVPFKIDPDRHYYGFIHPEGTQFNHYGEDQPDAQRMYELLEQGRSETDRDERVEIYSEFEKLVNEHCPWISVARADGLAGLRADVYGVQPWLLPYTRFWTMWTED